MANWKETIDLSGVFHAEGTTFTERRDAIVKIVKESKLYRNDSEMPMLVDELSDTVNTTEFDNVWDAIYDCADSGHAAWIKTF